MSTAPFFFLLALLLIMVKDGEVRFLLVQLDDSEFLLLSLDSKKIKNRCKLFLSIFWKFFIIYFDHGTKRGSFFERLEERCEGVGLNTIPGNFPKPFYWLDYIGVDDKKQIPSSSSLLIKNINNCIFRGTN